MIAVCADIGFGAGIEMTSKVGHYEFLAEFAAGGMATVHFGRLVRPGGFSKTVAIKRLRPAYAKDPKVVQMLLHEASVAALIDHPNVVSTLDVVTNEDDVFVVMEYVRGHSLSHILQAHRPSGARVPVRVVAGIFSGVLHGLHSAHDATDAYGGPLRIVHCDVSPQNILVGIDGVARVADFGVAKSVNSALSTTDEGRGVVGKLAYLAPETIAGVAPTVQTDIYAAGIVLWETLTGQRLFTGANQAEIVSAVRTYTPPPPSRLAKDVPGAVDDVVLRALERDPARRFGSAREMALALETAVPIALPSEIAAWAEPWIGSVVEQRSELFAVTRTQPVLRTLAAGATTISMHLTADAPASSLSRAKLRWIVAAGFVLVTLFGAAAVVARWHARPAIGTATATTTTSPSADIAVSAPSSSAATGEREPSAAPAIPVATSAHPAAAAPPPAVVRGGAGRVVRPLPPPHPAIDCTRKFTVDAEGRTIFRKECL